MSKTVRKSMRKKLVDKREKLSAEREAKRTAVRARVRCAVAVAGVCLGIVLLAGCNTATPSSKSARTTANDNVTTINNNFGFLVPGTNGVMVAGAPVVLGGGGLTVNVHDINGSIMQSADTEGGDSTDLTANPSMAAGITGDAPMKAITDAVSAFASPKAATDALLSGLVKKFGLGAVTNAVAESVETVCVDGSCSPSGVK